MGTVSGDSLGSPSVITNGMVEGHHQIHIITSQEALCHDSRGYIEPHTGTYTDKEN